jgi:hypothetical protein
LPSYLHSLKINDFNEIKYINSTTLQGINKSELRPAIKVKTIFQAIEDNYNVKFTGDFYDINAIIQIHKKPGELFIPAGTPLCQLLVVPDNKEEIIQKMQDNKNWKAELKNKFKNAHRFITKNL